MAWNIRDHELIECIEGGLRAVSLDRLPGDRYEDPELDVLLYLKRSLRLSGLPVIGRGLGIIGLIREPSDLQVETFEGASRIMTRATRAISTRFPPIRNGHGLAILSCLLITTSRPIAPHTETHLETLLGRPGVFCGQPRTTRHGPSRTPSKRLRLSRTCAPCRCARSTIQTLCPLDAARWLVIYLRAHSRSPSLR
jgi:hypothetical protein